jgi:hypothetical protein
VSWCATRDQVGGVWTHGQYCPIPHIGGSNSPGPKPNGNSSDRHCLGRQVFVPAQSVIKCTNKRVSRQDLSSAPSERGAKYVHPLASQSSMKACVL